MNYLDGLWKVRGRRFSASIAVPRHAPEPALTDRLAMDRLAVALGLPSADPPASADPTDSSDTADITAALASPASHSEAWLELANRVPQPMSGAHLPFQTGALAGALHTRGLVVPPPAVQVPAVPDTGRHRGAAEPLMDLAPGQASAARQPLHASASLPADGGPVPVVTAHEEVGVPVVSPLVVPVGGRHRRPASSGAAKRPVVLGVLVLLVALVAVLGVRVVSAISTPRTPSVATATYGHASVAESPADQSPSRSEVL
jgi:hypothetical protein